MGHGAWLEPTLAPYFPRRPPAGFTAGSTRNDPRPNEKSELFREERSFGTKSVGSFFGSFLSERVFYQRAFFQILDIVFAQFFNLPYFPVVFFSKNYWNVEGPS